MNNLEFARKMEEAGICPPSQVLSLRKDADELVRILQTSLNTAKRNRSLTHNSLIH